MPSATKEQCQRLTQLRQIAKKGPSKAADMSSVACIILGGGQGTRLYPLTTSRCKPALLFGGRYRLIDIPISNSLNAGITKIFVLTQFLARSLHKHIFHTYRHDPFSPGFIEVLSAEQRPEEAIGFRERPMRYAKKLSTFWRRRQNFSLFCPATSCTAWTLKR